MIVFPFGEHEWLYALSLGKRRKSVEGIVSLVIWMIWRVFVFSLWIILFISLTSLLYT